MTNAAKKRVFLSGQLATAVGLKNDWIKEVAGGFGWPWGKTAVAGGGVIDKVDGVVIEKWLVNKLKVN